MSTHADTIRQRKVEIGSIKSIWKPREAFAAQKHDEDRGDPHTDDETVSHGHRSRTADVVTVSHGARSPTADVVTVSHGDEILPAEGETPCRGRLH